MTFAPVQNRLGVQPVGTTVTCVNKSGETLVVGDLVITSFIHAGAVVNPEQAANTSYVFNCIRKASASESGNTGYLGVVTKLLTGVGGNGYNVEVQFGGICSAKVLVDATVTSGTLLGISATAGVLSNSVSTSDYSVTLMDNAAVADGTALKRVYIPTEYTFGSTSSSIPGFYGSRRASSFLRDAIAGTDSIDVLVIGDSNAGSSDYGYTVGIDRVLGYQYGIDMYATPLLAGGRYYDSSTIPQGDLFENMIGTGTYNYSNDDNTAGGTGSTGNQRLMVQCPAETANDALKTYLNFNSTNYTDRATTMLPQPNRYQWNPVVIPTGIDWTGTGNSNGIRILYWSPLTFSGAQSCQYRVVYGTYANGAGRFKLAITDGGSTTYAISAFRSTNNGTASVGYATEFLPYTTPATPITFRCAWDGAANAQANSRLVTGPFACLWQSFIALKKGYSVTNLTTSDGRSTTQIADRVEGMDKVLDALLKELRERQVAATGSGRLIVFVNSGVNGAETANTWTDATERIRNRIATRWASTGGDAAKLAFVFTVTHQLAPTYIGSGSSWITARATVSPAANTWATANANDGYGSCVVDTSVSFDYFELTNGSTPNGTMYTNTGSDQIHLNSSSSSRSNGYDGVSGAIFSTLLASA
jgi:hypothetical protein